MDQTNESKFYYEKKENLNAKQITESKKIETNFKIKNSKFNSNKDLLRSCPMKLKNHKEIEDILKNNNMNNLSDLSINKHNSLNDLQYKTNAIRNLSNLVLDNSLNNENSDAFNQNLNPYDYKKQMTPNFNGKVRFGSKHKTSTDINSFIENSHEVSYNKNQNSNSNQIGNDYNNRKYSFLYNFRNQANLLKDLKIIVKTLNFKEEIEKFTGLKICKHILERINMPPFRNVQIERKITEEPDHNVNSDNNMDEPLRINNIQILCFLIVLTLLFIIIILLIFLIDS